MMKKAIRFGIYLAGLAILALGIILNTKTGLGVSPVTSVPFVISQISGWSIGNTTLAFYIIYIVAEIVLKGKKAGVLEILQLPVSIVFTRIMNLFSAAIPMPTHLAGRILFLLLGIVFTGIGMAMSLAMRLVPNPGDGIVQAVSDFSGKEVGLCKRWFDGVMVVIAAAIALIASRSLLGIGIGTVAAVFGIGKTAGVFNKLCKEKLERLAGMPHSGKTDGGKD